MKRPAGRAGRPEERREQSWSQGRHAGGCSDSAAPPLQGHGCERLQQKAAPRQHTSGTDLSYSLAHGPHVLRMTGVAAAGCGRQGKERY